MTAEDSVLLVPNVASSSTLSSCSPNLILGCPGPRGGKLGSSNLEMFAGRQKKGSSKRNDIESYCLKKMNILTNQDTRIVYI